MSIASLQRVDNLVEGTRERAAAIGATVWGRAAGHLIHVTLFIALVLKRKHTVLPVAGWLERTLGTAMGGVPADAVRLAAASFDSIWKLLLSPFGL